MATYTQAQFDKLTKEDRDKQSFDLDSNDEIARRVTGTVTISQADFRLMMNYFAKMVTELEQIKLQLQVITDIEGDIEA